jgi:YesN/AraC family two-component response regulator
MLFAANGAEAVESAGATLENVTLENIDVLLTEVIRPNGRDLAPRSTAFHPQTETIFMSGYTNDIH